MRDTIPAMSVRMIIGIIAIAGVSTLGLLSTFTIDKMMDVVNPRLPKEQQFSPSGWYFQKTLRLHREYRRLFPDGNLHNTIRAMLALIFACLLAVAWAIGLL